MTKAKVQIPAKIERVFAAKPTWSAGRATGLERGEAFAFSGSLCAREGDELFLIGEWVEDPKWGRQFKVTEAARLDGKDEDPFDENALVTYLASNKDFVHVGPVRARALVQHFGGVDALSEALLERPSEIVALVPGLTEERVRVFSAQWALEYYLHKHRVELGKLGLSPLQAKRAIAALGPHAAAVLKKHPLDLWLVCPQLGFARVEQVAFRAGVERGSHAHKAMRALATVAEISAKEGHTMRPLSSGLFEAVTRYAVERPRFNEAVVMLLERNMIGLARYARPEQDILHFCRRAHAPSSFWANRTAPPTPAELSAEQRQAFELLIAQKAVLVLGGAGTGKTYLANHVADAFEDRGGNVEFCAPTGKAAKRLTETTGRPASTIHRLLGAKGDPDGGCTFAGENLEVDLLVVDELSMCDSVLLGALLERVPVTTSVLLMGDPQQLPPVAPGYPLRDMINRELMPAVKLLQVHRQGGPLKEACCAVLEGVCADLIKGVWHPCKVSAKNFQDVLLDILDELDQEGFDALEDVQVLTPFRRTRDELNITLQQFFNDSYEPPAPGAEQVVFVGDKVIQDVNDYQLGVFNGEVGVIEACEPETSITVKFEERRIVYNFDARDNLGVKRSPQRALKLAYALTVHKSQGSEYPVVIVVAPWLPEGHGFGLNLLHRNMLYTAVTRARERVYLLCTGPVLRRMLATLSVDERTTFLAEQGEKGTS